MAEPASIAASGQTAAGRIADPASHRDAATGGVAARLSTKGLLAAASSFVIWGALPLYLHPIHELSSFQIIAHRIVWACVLVVIWLAIRGDLWELRKHFSNPPILGRLVLSALLVTANWTGYVWAVGHGRVLEASLGYFINPLANVLLGVVFLRERLNVAQ
jgi:chloramphenicol-sensitive protein RarD